MIFFVIFLTHHKIPYYKLGVSTWGIETWLAGVAVSLLFIETRLGAGFIRVCLETRWLGQNGGFYVLE